MKILILGAAGQIAKMLRDNLLNETDHKLVLYARDANKRLELKDPNRETIISGDFQDFDKLVESLKGVDFVYLNAMRLADTLMILKAMKNSNAKYIAGANILGIYNEVKGEFGKWNESMFGEAGIPMAMKDSATAVEESGFQYTILRLTWLYNEEGNEEYILTDKGQDFIGTQVSRQAVARLISDIINEPEKFKNRNIGVGEPNTNWDRPSFYR